jgi:ribokinase
VNRKHRPIVVVGSINLDLVCRGKRIPAPGETLSADEFHTFNGGKGANQAVAVARLGHPVSMIGKVGDAEFGQRLRDGLKAAGVNAQAVETAKGTSSGVALITVDHRGQNSISVVPGANARVMPEDLDRWTPRLRSAGMILAQLEIPLQTVEYLAELAEQFAVPLMLDPAPARKLPRTLLRRVTFLTPNEAETCALCGIANREDLDEKTAAESAEHLLKQGARNVIVKMGRRGAYVATADGLRQMVPGFKVKAVDTTAAGDAFNGGLAVALLRGTPIAEAVRYASAVGAVSVTRAGAQPAMPVAAEVEGLLGTSGAMPRRPARAQAIG